MSKIESSAQFKHYQPQQILLLPPSLDELIDDHHLVRVINQVVNSMDISSLINQYKGGGTTGMVGRNSGHFLCFKKQSGVSSALHDDHGDS